MPEGVLPHLNSSAEPVVLTAAARAMMAALPDDVRPRELAEQFPRIVNKMAEIWKRPVLMDRLFDDLLVDRRGGRQGFPLGVLFEITTLKDHYQTVLYPRSAEAGTWDPRNRI